MGGRGEKEAGAPDDPGNATVNFRKEKQSNERPESTTDPDAKLAHKGEGKEAKLSYSGNLPVENRHGLIVNAEVLEANGTAEGKAALVMLHQWPGTRRVTAGADKAYGMPDCVAECRGLKVTPQVAHNQNRRGGSPRMGGRRSMPIMPSDNGGGSGLRKASGG